MRTKLTFYANVSSAFLSVVLNFIIMGIYPNIIVAAFTSVLSYFAAYLVLYFNIKKVFDFNYDVLHIFKIILSSIIMGGILMTSLRISASNIFMFAAAIPVAIATYFMVLYSIGGIRRSEINQIKTILSK